MVLDVIARWLAGSNAGQIGLAVALIAIVLYWRKVTKAGSAAESVGARIAFAAAAVGVLLLLGVVTGIDVARASSLASEAWLWLGEVFEMVWEVIRGWV